MADRQISLTPRKYVMFDTIRIPFQAAPLLSIVRFLHTFMFRIAPTLQVLATAAFVDGALAVLAGNAPAITILWPILAIGALLIYTNLNEVMRRTITMKFENALRLAFRSAITEKRARMTYANVENHETWDLIQRVSKNPEQSMLNGMSSIMGLGGMALQAAGLLGILLANVWWAAIAIFAIAVPMIYLGVKSGKANYQADRDVSKIERLFNYLHEVLMTREAVDERALFSSTNTLSPRWTSEYETARKHRQQVQKKWFIKTKSGGLVMSLLALIISAVLIPPVASGVLSVGLFIALVQASSGMVQMMSWELSNNIDNYTRQVEYLKDVTAFAALPDTPGALETPKSPAPQFTSLEFRDVSFKYPGTEKYVLKNMNMTLLPGRHYAFVGINGAGKTTVTKLITGLYPEYEGDIFINGKNLREYGQDELKSVTSVLFQDFAQYALTMRENIAIGDAAHMADESAKQRALNAANSLNLQPVYEKLPQGIDTPLGKIDGKGQDVSGGEWQRIAMARTVMSPAPLRILDEPTAALDPIGESDLYEAFGEITKGLTTVFISHRLGSCRLADEILVIDGGHVAEHGTHQQLMALGGLYCDMYESQRSWYQ